MNATTETFPERLARYRNQRGLSQEQLGVAAKLTGRLVGALERGDARPTLYALRGLARAFGLKVVDLITEDVDRGPDE